MDVITLIKKDHDRVEELFTQFKGGGGLTGLVKRVTGNVSSRQRRTAASKACRELETHTRLEEEIFYPAVQATGDVELRRLVGESLREHDRVKMQIRALQATEHGDEQLDQLMSQLEEDVQHHVEEEENEMLPRVEKLVSTREREELGRRMQARRGTRGGARAASPRGRSRARREERVGGRRRRQRQRTTKVARSRARGRARVRKRVKRSHSR